MNTPIVSSRPTPIKSPDFVTTADQGYAAFIVGSLAQQELLRLDEMDSFQSTTKLVAALLAYYRIAASADEHCPLPFDW